MIFTINFKYRYVKPGSKGFAEANPFSDRNFVKYHRYSRICFTADFSKRETCA